MKIATDTPQSLTLRAEPEFSNGGLAARFRESLGEQALPEPITPAEYGRFSARDLILTRHRGAFIKPCPATPNYNCCGLSIFHFGQGCTLGCRYCILEAYLGSSALVLFGNFDEGAAVLAELLKQPATERPRRFCTGEFTDSLLLDSKSRLAETLIRLFAEHDGDTAVLELKTKTDKVDHLLKLDHRGRTVVSFSVNAPRICAEEEGRAAPLSARLAAAARAAEAGYPIGLHFDPLIFHEGWEDGYAETARLIGEKLGGAEIAWVSLGAFRYLSPLKDVMLAKHPDSPIYDGEFIKGGDGKMRYPRPLRARLYRHLASELKAALPPAAVLYMCMESRRVWRDVFGDDPGTEGLTALLDRRADALFFEGVR